MSDGALDPFYPVLPDAAWVARIASQGAKFIQLRVKDMPPHAVKAEIARALEFASAHDCQYFLQTPSGAVLAAVEVGKVNRLSQLIHHGHCLGGGSEYLLARDIDIRVVQHQGDVGERRQTDR